MDRAAVVAVERRVYSREYQEPQHLIEARLRYEDDHYGSLNLGLFAGDELVGYVLAHLDDGAEIPGQAIGDNVYVADMAVLPGYQRHLIKLLTAFSREARLEYPGLPIVAHAIRETGKMWKRHQAGLPQARLRVGCRTRRRHHASGPGCAVGRVGAARCRALHGSQATRRCFARE